MQIPFGPAYYLLNHAYYKDLNIKCHPFLVVQWNKFQFVYLFFFSEIWEDDQWHVPGGDSEERADGFYR